MAGANNANKVVCRSFHWPRRVTNKADDIGATRYELNATAADVVVSVTASTSGLRHNASSAWFALAACAVLMILHLWLSLVFVASRLRQQRPDSGSNRRCFVSSAIGHEHFISSRRDAGVVVACLLASLARVLLTTQCLMLS